MEVHLFGKTVETRKGVFKAGQPLPPEWLSRETIRQLRAQYGQDAVVAKDAGADTLEVLGQRVASIEQSLDEIKKALGVGASKADA